jgi:hypothetical protein
MPFHFVVEMAGPSSLSQAPGIRISASPFLEMGKTPPVEPPRHKLLQAFCPPFQQVLHRAQLIPRKAIQRVCRGV